jgi:hypothetical protein
MKKSIATLLVTALTLFSSAPQAYAVVARIAVRSAPSATGHVGAVGTLGHNANLATLSTLSPALSLTSSLGTVTPQLLVAPQSSPLAARALNTALSAPALPSGAAASAMQQSAAQVATPRATTRVALKTTAKTIAPQITAAANLKSASGDAAYTVGRQLDAALFDKSRLRSGSVAGANFVSMEEVVPATFAKDWVDVDELYDAAARSGSASGEFLFAEIDISNKGGVLNLQQARLGFWWLKHERYTRTIVERDGESRLTVRDDQSGYNVISMNHGGRLSAYPGVKVTLKKAIQKVLRGNPGFVPVRVLARATRGGAGLTYHLTDGQGGFVDVDATTGKINWTPKLGGDSASQNFVNGTVPKPTLEGTARVAFERIPLDWVAILNITLGSVVVASWLTGMTLIAGLLGVPLIPAGIVIAMIAAVAAVGVASSAVEMQWGSDESRVTNVERWRLGETMMWGTLGFFALVATAAWLGIGISLSAASFAGVAGLGGVLFGHPQGDKIVTSAHLSSYWPSSLLVSPAAPYERAYKEAVRVAKSKGLTEKNVYFGDAAASTPVRDGQHWKYTFYLLETPDQEKAYSVFVEMSSGWTVGFDHRTHGYNDVAVPGETMQLTPQSFAQLIRTETEPAIDAARRVHPDLGGGLSISLKAGAEGQLRYHLFDDYGAEVTVNAATRNVNVVREAESRGERRRKGREQRDFLQGLKNIDSWLGTKVPFYTVLKWLAILGGLIFLMQMASASAAVTAGAAVVGMGGMMFGAPDNLLPNPAEMYERALKEATEIAVGKEGQVDKIEFVKATASYLEDQKWTFTFLVPQATADSGYHEISIVFKGGLTVVSGQFETSGYSRDVAGTDATIEHGRELDAKTFATILRQGPEQAIDAAIVKEPNFSRRSSVALVPSGKSAGMQYRIYDEQGYMATVDPVNGEAFVRDNGVTPKAVKAEPSSGGFLAALDSIARLAVALLPAGGAAYLYFAGLSALPQAVVLGGGVAVALYFGLGLIVRSIEQKGGFLSRVHRRWLGPTALTGGIMLASAAAWYVAALQGWL